jgi:hypothetical protein
MSNLAKREAILAAGMAATLNRSPVSLPDGTTGHAVELTAAERDRFDQDHFKAGRANFRARMVAYSIRDETGALVFSPAEDVAILADWPSSLLEPLAVAAVAVNRLEGDAPEGK